MSTILSLETSCDDTACAIIEKKNNSIHVLSNVISSQTQIHSQNGGVIPNLAAREHTKNILPVIENTLSQARCSIESLDALAVTIAPGLIPALLVGTTTAQTLSWLWKKPLLGIHHIEGHIYANFAPKDENDTVIDSLRFPLLALVVSGGHTQLVLMKEHFSYSIIGETQDDAVGEAFDKTARVLGLPYPGGPEISRLAQEFRNENGNENIIQFPRPMIHSPNFHFSFSGLKTAVLYTVKTYRKENNLSENDPLPKHFQKAVSAGFEDACVDVLLSKTQKAIERFSIQSVLIAGGVSANIHLREMLKKCIDEKFPHIFLRLPQKDLSLDNAAMIGIAGLLRWDLFSDSEKQKASTLWKNLEARANFSLEDYAHTMK
ncbi:MAG: tRNA (adenosine(37)-N6)-threonylcarbamoyltransferase complex transferase subunit TsaD [Candidatus Moraniibacteriota bacterium]|nr:MAG: tRNA (adenosine(37)-N6)-threonylcarbamoyltransferase complex transferase subunit TsaD [Candidatus Moranbacteria bacterium]